MRPSKRTQIKDLSALDPKLLFDKQTLSRSRDQAGLQHQCSLFDKAPLGKHLRTLKLKDAENPFQDPSFFLLGPTPALAPLYPNHRVGPIEINFSNNEQIFIFEKTQRILAAAVVLKWTERGLISSSLGKASP